MENDPLVELYHGTAGILGNLINERKRLSPKPGNKYVYLTTDRNVALQYSRAWTAWALKEVKDKRRRVKAEGVIVKIFMRKSLLEDDPFNPEDEPNQYRVEGPIWLEKGEYKIERVDLSELNDESKQLAALCYWVGVARATD